MASKPRYYRIAGRIIQVNARGENLGFHAPEWDRWNPFRMEQPKPTIPGIDCEPGVDCGPGIDWDQDAAPTINCEPDIIYELEEHETITAENGQPYPLGPPTIIKHSAHEYTVGLVGFHMELHLTPKNPIIARVKLRNGFAPKALRVPMSIHLMEHDAAFMLHSSAVLPPSGDSAHVFFAEPDTGKTTAARCAPKGSIILSDETTAIFPHRKVVMSTPFGGDLSPSPISAPIAGIYFLEQSPRDRLTKMNPKEAVPLILRQTMLTSLDSEATAAAFDAAHKLCTQIPAYRLECRDRGLFWPMLLQNHSENHLQPSNNTTKSNHSDMDSDKNTQANTHLEKTSHGPC